MPSFRVSSDRNNKIKLMQINKLKKQRVQVRERSVLDGQVPCMVEI